MKKNRSIINIIGPLFLLALIILYAYSVVDNLRGYDRDKPELSEIQPGIIENITKEEYLSDFDYLIENFSATYPFIETAKDEYGLNWNDEVSKVREELIAMENIDDNIFEDKLSTLLALFKNGHMGFLKRIGVFRSTILISISLQNPIGV